MTARVVTYERSGDQRKIDCNTRTGWQLGSSAHLIRGKAASDDGDADAGDGFLFSFSPLQLKQMVFGMRFMLTYGGTTVRELLHLRCMYVNRCRQ